tara:strand:+ start:428 stop:664 length:237 start_codon:yes stop_codon:yes gene_type:complete
VHVVDNGSLDPGEITVDGYAVFGQVTAATDVVDAMGVVATDSNDAPFETVLIEDIERLWHQVPDRSELTSRPGLPTVR